MSEMDSDRELLRRYLGTGAEGAFRELVRRHGRMILGTATRVTGTPHAAEEIAQAVFITLAEKAHWLTGHDSLAGWLHRTTVNKAQSWSRGEHRRRQREQAAYEQASVMQQKSSLSARHLALLDEALLHLSDAERELVVLRHCEGQSYPEIARQLGLREDAVRKRCDKAMEQVLAFFRKQGVTTLSVTLAAGALDSTAMPLATTFVSAMTKAATTAAPVAALGIIPAWIGKLMALSKVQTAAMVIAMAAVPIAYEAGRMQTANRNHQLALVQLEDLEKRLAEINATYRTTQTRLARAGQRTQQLMAVVNPNASAPEATPVGWVEGGGYTRISKSAALALQFPGINRQGQTTPALEQLLGFNGGEKAAVAQALNQFAATITAQNEAHLRRGEEAKPNAKVERVAFTIAQHQEEAKQAARALETEVMQALGPERGRMALRNFNLPLLPNGTTDYTKNYGHLNAINMATAPTQGLEWNFVFHRQPGTTGTTRPWVTMEFKGIGGSSQLTTSLQDLDIQALPPSLRAFWQQWKTGAPVPRHE